MANSSFLQILKQVRPIRNYAFITKRPGDNVAQLLERLRTLIVGLLFKKPTESKQTFHSTQWSPITSKPAAAAAATTSNGSDQRFNL